MFDRNLARPALFSRARGPGDQILFSLRARALLPDRGGCCDPAFGLDLVSNPAARLGGVGGALHREKVSSSEKQSDQFAPALSADREREEVR